MCTKHHTPDAVVQKRCSKFLCVYLYGRISAVLLAVLVTDFDLDAGYYGEWCYRRVLSGSKKVAMEDLMKWNAMKLRRVCVEERELLCSTLCSSHVVFVRRGESLS